MGMKRRTFLKTLGAGTAGIAAFSCSDQEAARRIAGEQGGTQDADLTWSKAPCRYCGTGCGVEVGVKEGRIVAVLETRETTREEVMSYALGQRSQSEPSA